MPAVQGAVGVVLQQPWREVLCVHWLLRRGVPEPPQRAAAVQENWSLRRLKRAKAGEGD